MRGEIAEIVGKSGEGLLGGEGLVGMGLKLVVAVGRIEAAVKGEDEEAACLGPRWGVGVLEERIGDISRVERMDS